MKPTQQEGKGSMLFDILKPPKGSYSTVCNLRGAVQSLRLGIVCKCHFEKRLSATLVKLGWIIVFWRKKHINPPSIVWPGRNLLTEHSFSLQLVLLRAAWFKRACLYWSFVTCRKRRSKWWIKNCSVLLIVLVTHHQHRGANNGEHPLMSECLRIPQDDDNLCI